MPEGTKSAASAFQTQAQDAAAKMTEGSKSAASSLQDQAKEASSAMGSMQESLQEKLGARAADLEVVVKGDGLEKGEAAQAQKCDLLGFCGA